MFIEKRNEILEDLGFLRSNYGYYIGSDDVMPENVETVDQMIKDGLAEENDGKIWVDHTTTWSELILCINNVCFMEMKI